VRVVNDRAYTARGFGFMRVNVVANVHGLPCGFVERRETWSAAGVAAYASIREQAEAMVSLPDDLCANADAAKVALDPSPC
jgi:hypothetical protein